MITDIPSAEDFRHAGIAYLNLAWGMVLDLAINLGEAKVEEWDDEGTVANDYWDAAQRPLATAVSLLQQGVEFLIKAQIADVSPFLLFDGSPSDWPHRCNQVDTSFSAFKTIDAQDLIRAHDTVTTTRLTEDFVSMYEHLRTRRNTIMHTVDPSLRFTTTEVIVPILEVAEVMIGPQQWISVRETSIEQEPLSVAYSESDVEAVLARECLYLIDTLGPALLRRFFGFNPRQRRYYCYNCQLASSDWGLKVTTAQLRPNTPTSKTIYCFVCRQTSDVVRQSCSQADCRGNVLDAEDNVCLTCYN